MKHFLPILIFFLSYSFSFAQNVGIGTSNPETKLKVEGAVSYKVETIPAANSIVIPENVSIAYITNNASVSSNNTSATNPKEGQLLTIYNADAESVNFSGELIDAVNGVASFVYINGNWRLTAKNNAGWNLTGNVATTASTTNPVINQKANNNFIGTIDDKDLVFATNGFERMRIKTASDGISGNVGIGTLNPSHRFEVVGKSKIHGDVILGTLSFNNSQIRANTSTYGRPPYSFMIDSTTGVFIDNDTTLGFSTKGAERMRISKDGRIKIGSSTAFNNYLHDVRGNSQTVELYVNDKFMISSGQTVYASRGDEGSPAYSFRDNNNLGIFSPSPDVLGFSVSSVERMRINSSGNVGIGHLSPQSKLDVSSTNVVTANSTPGILNVMTNETGGAADVGGSISLGGYRNTASEFRVYGTIEGRKSLSSTTSSSGYLVFKTNDAGVLSERMRIFNDGLVRINDLAGSGIRVVTAGADGSLGASSIGTLETDPTWSENASTTGTTGIISRDGRVMTSSSFIVGTTITTATGPGTGVDNQYHNVVFPNSSTSRTAMTGISIYATGAHLDGDIKIFGIPMTDLLTVTSSWYGVNAGLTSAGSTTNTNSSGADDQFHTAQCPDNRIATGIEIYASGALDGNMKLRCNTLATGYSTTNNGAGVESLINTPFNDANNITHMSTCPAGTFVKGIRIYASSRLDNQVQVFCTGIKKD